MLAFLKSVWSWFGQMYAAAGGEPPAVELLPLEQRLARYGLV